jgi:hypothetical protein
LEKSQNAQFIKPMECLPVEKIPEGDNWTYELLCGRPHKISSVAQRVMWRWRYGAGQSPALTISNAT